MNICHSFSKCTKFVSYMETTDSLSGLKNKYFDSNSMPRPAWTLFPHLVYSHEKGHERAICKTMKRKAASWRHFLLIEEKLHILQRQWLPANRGPSCQQLGPMHYKQPLSFAALSPAKHVMWCPPLPCAAIVWLCFPGLEWDGDRAAPRPEEAKLVLHSFTGSGKPKADTCL